MARVSFATTATIFFVNSSVVTLLLSTCSQSAAQVAIASQHRFNLSLVVGDFSTSRFNFLPLIVIVLC